MADPEPDLPSAEQESAQRPTPLEYEAPRDRLAREVRSRPLFAGRQTGFGLTVGGLGSAAIMALLGSTAGRQFPLALAAMICLTLCAGAIWAMERLLRSHRGTSWDGQKWFALGFFSSAAIVMLIGGCTFTMMAAHLGF